MTPRLHWVLFVALTACAPAGSDRVDRAQLAEGLDPCFPTGTVRRLSDHELWHRVKCHCGGADVVRARYMSDFFRFRLLRCGTVVDIDIRVDGTITSASACPSSCDRSDAACTSPPSFPSPECTPGDAGAPAIVPASSDAGVVYEPGWDAGSWSEPDAGAGWEWSWPDAGAGWDPWADAGPGWSDPWGSPDAGPGWQWESYPDAGDSYDEGW